MKINNIEIQELSLNNQILYVPEMNIWKELIELNPEIDGERLIKSEDMKKLLLKNTNFFLNYSIFALAFYRPVSTNQRWLYINLIDMNARWQRFHLEYLTCPKCDWKGATANPVIADLYFGIENYWKEFNAGYDLPRVPCPKCKAELPRPAIWAQDTT
ncbi:hypothetical protein [Paenibacillus chitinolyticus]|uniref:hypothetical protein n=1 Tax=Paenibacillus chitinolyticus TaxID=79263 RepID=UPI00363C32E7